MDNKGWISIIVPVYNAEAGLQRCLDSLERQTYRKLEVIFVNDCSTDGGMEMIAYWAASSNVGDFRIQIVNHMQNRGVAAARNTGLSYVTGEYIYYVDADDYIEPDTLEKMVEAALQTGAEIVGCEWLLSFSKNERIMRQPDVACGLDLFKRMCYGVMRWNLWLFLVKSELYRANNICFIEKQNMGEDMMVMMKLALHTGKVVMLHQPFYHYVQTNVNSLTKSWSAEYRRQVTFNMEELERYTFTLYADNYQQELACLKLNIKLPLLVTGRKADYETWLHWFPEANPYIWHNKEIAWRTRLLQDVASRHWFLPLKMYYWIVIKLVYGIVYR